MHGYVVCSRKTKYILILWPTLREKDVKTLWPFILHLKKLFFYIPTTPHRDKLISCSCSCTHFVWIFLMCVEWKLYTNSFCIVFGTHITLLCIKHMNNEYSQTHFYYTFSFTITILCLYGVYSIKIYILFVHFCDSPHVCW